MQLTAKQKLMKKIIAYHFDLYSDDKFELNDSNIEELYEKLEINNAESEIREGEYETNLDAPYSRHYECKMVASEMLDGSFVAWPYWYGGGKHANPEEIEWIDAAVDVLVEEKTVVVKEFKLKEKDGE